MPQARAQVSQQRPSAARTSAQTLFLNIQTVLPFLLSPWVFVAMHRLSLVPASWGHSSLQFAGFSSLLWKTGSRSAGLRNCSSQAQQLWLVGLAAPRHVGFSHGICNLPGPVSPGWQADSFFFFFNYFK